MIAGEAALREGEALEDGLVGHLDSVQVDKRFITLQGWVARASHAGVALPISFTVHGRSYSGYKVGMRPDLAQVGIAEGLAGFSVYIPIANVQLDTDIEITIHDALGARCALTCPAGRVTDYEPRGYIDSLDGSLITGWVFDPLLLYSFEAPSLHFRYEQICQLQLTLERPDLLSDSGDGLKTFGFEVASAILIEEMARQKFTPGQAGLLTLVSSGYELSALSVTLEHDKSLSSLRALETAAGGRVPVSDWLDASLKTQKIPATKAGRRK